MVSWWLSWGWGPWAGRGKAGWSQDPSRDAHLHSTWPLTLRDARPRGPTVHGTSQASAKPAPRPSSESALGVGARGATQGHGCRQPEWRPLLRRSTLEGQEDGKYCGNRRKYLSNSPKPVLTSRNVLLRPKFENCPGDRTTSSCSISLRSRTVWLGGLITGFSPALAPPRSAAGCRPPAVRGAVTTLFKGVRAGVLGYRARSARSPARRFRCLMWFPANSPP